MSMIVMNRIFGVEQQKMNITRRAEQYLGVLGVTQVLPDLWDAVIFEMNTSIAVGDKWTYRKLAHRYLSLLRDRVTASSIRNEREGD